MFSLKEKITMVTGAGSGIGAAIAEVFADAGAYVFVTDIDESAAKETVARIRDRSGEAEHFKLDVTDADDCKGVAKGIHDSKGHLDVLVNNAGAGHVGTLTQTSGEEMDRLYKINVRGGFNVTRVFLPGMLERGVGNVINLASIAGVVGVRDRFAYTTSKFAVVGMTKALALDHAQDGIRANCICPGRVRTPFVDARLKEYDDPEKAFREMSASQPQGRMGQPEEIAYAALYLASDESGYVTGTTFMIDGGWSAG